MPPELIVDITASDIKNGLPNHSMKCPLARALRRMFPGAEVDVRMYVVTIHLPQENHYYYPTASVWEFFRRFDNGLLVEPTTVTLQHS